MNKQILKKLLPILTVLISSHTVQGAALEIKAHAESRKITKQCKGTSNLLQVDLRKQPFEDKAYIFNEGLALYFTKPFCFFCGKLQKKHYKATLQYFRLCGSCKVAKYCSKQCQKNNWNISKRKIGFIHREACQALKDVCTHTLDDKNIKKVYVLPRIILKAIKWRWMAFKYKELGIEVNRYDTTTDVFSKDQVKTIYKIEHDPRTTACILEYNPIIRSFKWKIPYIQYLTKEQKQVYLIEETMYDVCGHLEGNSTNQTKAIFLGFFSYFVTNDKRNKRKDMLHIDLKSNFNGLNDHFSSNYKDPTQKFGRIKDCGTIKNYSWKQYRLK
jgi:hypothetical protein